jgi:hypothetical protein
MPIVLYLPKDAGLSQHYLVVAQRVDDCDMVGELPLIMIMIAYQAHPSLDRLPI